MNETLTTFFYILMRDEVPFGVIERILKDHIEVAHHPQLVKSYSCPLMENKARELAERIMEYENTNVVRSRSKRKRR